MSIIFRRLSLPALLSLVLPHADASLLGVTNDNRLWDLNTTTGAASNPRAITGLSVGASEIVTGLTAIGSVLYGYTNASRLYSINSTTAAATLIGTGRVAGSDIAYDPLSGNIFGLTSGTVATMFTLNPANAATTTVGSHNSPFNEPPQAGGGLVSENRASLTFSPGGALWGTTRTVSLNVDSVTELRQYDPVTGQILQRIDDGSSFDAGEGDIAFDPQTGLLYYADGPSLSTGSLFILSTTSGDVTEVGITGVSATNSIGFTGLAFTDVPEPSSMLLLGYGILLLAKRYRRSS